MDSNSTFMSDDRAVAADGIDNENGPLDFCDWLTETVMEFVNDTDRLRIDSRVERGVQIFTIRVAEADRGFVIGRRGQTIELIRQLLGRMAARKRCRALVHMEGEPIPWGRIVSNGRNSAAA